jgi:hypothetical protein
VSDWKKEGIQMNEQEGVQMNKTVWLIAALIVSVMLGQLEAYAVTIDEVPGGGQNTQYPLETQASSKVYASTVDFVNPLTQPLTGQGGLCNYCLDPGVFPGNPDYNTSGVADLSSQLSFDPTPYYTKAIQQQSATQPYHHITADTTIDGNQLAGPLEGVIYVEAGKTLTLQNTVVIHGTIVHEGMAVDALNTRYFGSVKLAAGSSVTIDSFHPTDINQDTVPEDPFAPGAAVVGSPMLEWKNTASLGNGTSDPGINGFVMAGDFVSLQPNGLSFIAANGMIRGGVIGVAPSPASLADPEPLDCPGPCTALGAPWTYTMGIVNLANPATLQFQALPSVPLGFPQAGNGLDKPAVLLWDSQ